MKRKLTLNVERLEDRDLMSFTAGPEFSVGGGYSYNPAVVVQPNHEVATVRMENHFAPDGWNVEGRRYDFNGSPVGPNVVVAGGDGAQEFPSLSARPDGTMALTWESEVDQVFSAQVKLINPDLSELTTALRADQDSAGYQTSPTAAWDQNNGNFTVSWVGIWDGTSVPTWARDFDPNGNPIGNQYEAASPISPPLPVTLSVSGGVLTTHTAEGDFVVNETTGPADPLYPPTVSVADDGDFAVAWTSVNATVYARCYSYTPPSAPATFALPIRYYIGPDSNVWDNQTGARLANGRVKDVAAAKDGFGNGLVFVIGLDDRVWAVHVGSDGRATGGYYLTGEGRVKSLVTTRNISNYGNPTLPEIVVVGLDDRYWKRRFTADGVTASQWRLV